MDQTTLLFLFRGMERLLIIISGGGLVLIGALLFKWEIKGPSSWEVTRKDGSRWFTISSVFPGVLICLFGMIILMGALCKPLSIVTQTTQTTAPTPDINGKLPTPESMQTTSQGTVRVEYSGGNVPCEGVCVMIVNDPPLNDEADLSLYQKRLELYKTKAMDALERSKSVVNSLP